MHYEGCQSQVLAIFLSTFSQICLLCTYSGFLFVQFVYQITTICAEVYSFLCSQGSLLAVFRRPYGNQTHISYLPGKCPNHCTIALAPLKYLYGQHSFTSLDSMILYTIFFLIIETEQPCLYLVSSTDSLYSQKKVNQDMKIS